MSHKYNEKKLSSIGLGGDVSGSGIGKGFYKLEIEQAMLPPAVPVRIML